MEACVTTATPEAVQLLASGDQASDQSKLYCVDSGGKFPGSATPLERSTLQAHHGQN